MKDRLSVVLPVYRNEATLDAMHRRLAATLGTMEIAGYEMIFVDDASPDGSWEVIEALAATDPNVVGLRLRSNVGQLRALCAGLAVARGDVLATMDADLEHPPESIPELVHAFEEGHDLVVARRIGHSSEHLRAIGSMAFNLLARLLRLPAIGVGSSFLVGSPDVGVEMRRIVERTGRQLILPTVFELAHAPTVVDVELSATAESSYTLQGVVRLGGELLAAELGPRLARRVVAASVSVMVLAVHPPWRRRALRFAGSLAGLGVVGLLVPLAFRRDRSEPLYEVTARLGTGLGS